MRPSLINVAVALCLLVCTTSPAFADTEEIPSNCLSGEGAGDLGSECISSDELLGGLDLVTPENSLFTLMGSAPDSILRPKTGDKFMLSILPQVSDAFGSDQYSIGIEVNPGLLQMPEKYTISEFLGTANPRLDGSLQRTEKLRAAKFWSQFTISAAATKTTGETTTNKYGLGVNFLRDSGSPFYAQATFGNCTKEALEGESSPAEVISEIEGKLGAEQAQLDESEQLSGADYEAELTRRVESNADYIAAVKRVLTIEKACVSKAAPWNRKIIGAGIAAIRSDSSSLPASGTMPLIPEDKATGWASWGSYVFPTSDHGQATIGVKYSENVLRERKSDTGSIVESVDGWNVGAQYTHSFSEDELKTKASERSLRGFVEVSYGEEKFGAIADEFTQAGIGFEIQLQKNIFFQAVVGDTWGSQIERSGYLSGQLKWALSGARAN